MDVRKASEIGTGRGNRDHFTGDVTMQRLHEAPAPARVNVVRVTFAPGARTNWHTHPLGQTLIILSGTGRVQKKGEPVLEVQTGDVIWFAPDEHHWHGAAPDQSMAHIALQESLDGTAVTWLEPVADDDYLAKAD